MRTTTLRRAGKLAGAVLVPVALLASAPADAARVFKTFLHAFSGTPDGAVSEGGVVLGADGALYGMTIYGGVYGYDPVDNSNGNGTIFRVASDNTYSVAYSFTHLDSVFGNVDGRWPSMPLFATPDGAVYGTAPYGGTADGGSVFRYSTNEGFVTLHSFEVSGSDPGGTRPQAPVTVGPDGAVYGTTEYGGTDFPDDGVLFRMNSDGSQYQVLQSFGSTAHAELPNGGLLLASDGMLYGIAQYYDGYAGGALYRIAPDGSGFSIVHEFDYGIEGGYYYVGVIAAPIEGPDGYLYGVIDDGGDGGAGSAGSGNGAIYRVARDGSDFSILHAFSAYGSGKVNSDGGDPRTALQLGTDGLLYGATMSGGANGRGVLYRLAMDGSGFTTLYNFPALRRRGTNSLGANPMGSIALRGKHEICGTTYAGGANGAGTVYCLRAR